MIEQDTIRLLRECDAGIQMSEEAIDEVLDNVKSGELSKCLNRSKQVHGKLKQEMRALLEKYHDQGKTPSPMAKGMAWVKTNTKLALDDSDSTIAGLITDGCNMGVKTLNQYLNQYKAADALSKDLAKRLIREETQLAEDVRSYL